MSDVGEFDATPPMMPGCKVVVTNLDGETVEGELVKTEDRTLAESDADWWGPGRTLADYWRGAEGVDPGDRVATVRLGEMKYEYPVSRVEVVNDVE